jgi:hypothetical protein
LCLQIPFYISSTLCEYDEFKADAIISLVTVRRWHLVGRGATISPAPGVGSMN